MQIKAGRSTIVVDLPHLAVVTAIVGFCWWYFLHARAASNTLENLLLIEPAAIGALILYVIILRDVVQIVRDPEALEVTRAPLARIVRYRIFGCMALLCAYVAAMGLIGFDLATVLYVGLTLALLGERRPVMLTLLPLIFGIAVVYLFRQMITVPVPTFLELLT